jgi:hypothetical protein
MPKTLTLIDRLLNVAEPVQEMLPRFDKLMDMIDQVPFVRIANRAEQLIVRVNNMPLERLAQAVLNMSEQFRNLSTFAQQAQDFTPLVLAVLAQSPGCNCNNNLKHNATMVALLSRFEPKVFENLNPELVRRVTPDLVLRTDPDFVNALRPGVLRNINPDVALQVNETFLRMTDPEVLNSLPDDVIRDLTPEIVSTFDEQLLESADPELLRNLDSETIRSLLFPAPSNDHDSNSVSRNSRTVR